MTPIFFILGAPKCGTTSLAFWLSQHPEIAFSVPKEPRYFNSDFKHPFRPLDIDAYEDLFPVTEKTKWRGEGTTGYLCSDVAVERILSYSAKAKFIVCIRPHLELFLSLHRQRLKEGFESVKDPLKAWMLQEDRLMGRESIGICPDPKLLHYARYCSIGEQISRLYKAVDSSRVLVSQLQDIAASPECVYSQVCQFLCISEAFSPSFEIKNTGSLPLSTSITKFTRTMGMLRTKFGVRPLGVASLIQNVNLKREVGPKIDSDFADYFKRYFAADQAYLEKIVNSK